MNPEVLTPFYYQDVWAVLNMSLVLEDLLWPSVALITCKSLIVNTAPFLIAKVEYWLKEMLKQLSSPCILCSNSKLL